MCVICIKNPGVVFPNEETLKVCFTANPDGAGYMWAKDGSVNIRKGFSTYEAFRTSIANELGDVSLLNDLPMVLHFRIGTHGSNNSPEHTHPFPLSDNYVSMTQLSLQADTGVCHNGIYTIPDLAGGYSKTVKAPEDGGVNPSDSMEFIRNIIYPLSLIPNWKNREDVKKLIDAFNGFSKLVLLSKDGSFLTFGTFVTDEATGLVYSNDSFRPREYNSHKYQSKTDIYDYPNILFEEHQCIRQDLEAWCAKNLRGLGGGYDEVKLGKFQIWFKPATINYIATGTGKEHTLKTLDPNVAYYLDNKRALLYYLDETTDELMLMGNITSWDYMTPLSYSKERKAVCA